jgi:uncharacterized membrane protein YheB (UPF0754 family)
MTNTLVLFEIPALWIAALSQLVIATVHGLLGAWLAVRMVFRPLRPIYILGWKLPFTPGMIPAERESFLERFAGVIADRVLTVETITDEIVNLGIQSEIHTVSAQHYTEQTTSEDFLTSLAQRFVGVLEDERNAEPISRRVNESLSAIVVAEVGEKYGFIGKIIANRLIETGLIKKILTLSLKDIARQLSRNPVSREGMVNAITAVGQQVFSGTGTGEFKPLPTVAPDQEMTVVDDFVKSLSRRLDIERIMREQLNGFSNEMIEDLVYRAAGRELNMIIRFGAFVGFGIGIIQAGLVLLGS